jgi:hypothetical protein
MLTLFVIWAALASIVAGLALFRKLKTRDEDDSVHLSGGANAVVHQQSLNRTLEVIDKWEKLLITLVVVYGLALLGAYLYISWNQSQTIQ